MVGIITTRKRKLNYYMTRVLKAKITRRKITQPEFKKPPIISGLEYLSNYYKKLDMPKMPERQNLVLSRRVDEGTSKDYRNNGIIAGNKNGRFSTRWTNSSGREYKTHWDARRDTQSDEKITRFKDARNQLSVLSSAIDSYDYYPDVKRLLLRYTSNPGKTYMFGNVTERRKKDLDEAASKGRFVQYVLRKYNHI